MINYEEARALKLFFLGLNKSLLKTINIHQEVLTAMRDLAIFEMAYTRISQTNDVFMELVNLIDSTTSDHITLPELSSCTSYATSDPVNLRRPLELTRRTCYALDLAPIFIETEFSSLKNKTNYLIKKEHIEYYFKLVDILNEAIKDHFTPIDISKYIMTAQK